MNGKYIFLQILEAAIKSLKREQDTKNRKSPDVLISIDLGSFVGKLKMVLSVLRE